MDRPHPIDNAAQAAEQLNIAAEQFQMAFNAYLGVCQMLGVGQAVAFTVAYARIQERMLSHPQEVQERIRHATQALVGIQQRGKREDPDERATTVPPTDGVDARGNGQAPLGADATRPDRPAPREAEGNLPDAHLGRGSGAPRVPPSDR